MFARFDTYWRIKLVANLKTIRRCIWRQSCRSVDMEHIEMKSDFSSLWPPCLLVRAIVFSLRACFLTSFGIHSNILPCHIWEKSTYTGPQMVRTTAISSRCWVLQILHTRGRFLVSISCTHCDFGIDQNSYDNSTWRVARRRLDL